MRRREFITLFGGAAATWPIAARAQQSIPAIGYLSPGGPPTPSSFAAFNKGLAETGFIEGRNAAIVLRSTTQYDRLPALVAEMISLPVAVIYAYTGVNAALAAKAATTTIPIVFVNGGDPVRLGLVASLNRPGGNVTGATFFSAGLAAKRLELLRELVPSATLIAFLVNPANDRADDDIDDMEAAARSVGQEIMVARASTVAEMEIAFAAIAERRAGAILIAGDPLLGRRPDVLAVLAARYRIPTSYANRNSVENGGLMSYGDDRAETFRQSGIYVGRVLKGEKPADLPILQPTKFELVINLKTAKTLALEIPAKLLALADEVIE